MPFGILIGQIRDGSFSAILPTPTNLLLILSDANDNGQSTRSTVDNFLSTIFVNTVTKAKTASCICK